MKKILFSDIDGTIANDNLPITYKDQEAVKKLRTQGHYFSFCMEEIFKKQNLSHHILNMIILF